MIDLDSYITFNTHQRGHSHIEENRECEDYSLSGRTEKCLYAIVCDGHGGSPHFRSQLGAKFCTEEIEKALKEFSEQVDIKNLMENPENLLRDLVDSILCSWLGRVDAHFAENGLPDSDISEDEPRWNKVSPEDKAAYRNDLSGDGNIQGEGLKKYIPYGTTFKFACVLQNFYFCVQLGDGTFCYKYEEKYTVVDKLIADVIKDRESNVTPSTCTCYQNQFRNVCYDWGDKIPEMLLCLTDGVDDSKAMRGIKNYGSCEDDETQSSFLKEKSHLYYSFIKNEIVETVRENYKEGKKILDRNLGEKIGTLCEDDFHWHDDIGIAGIIDLNDLEDRK